jgi:hypothetical protein
MASTKEFVEQASITDEIRSAHLDMLRIKDYSNQDIFPTEKLKELHKYWESQSENPLRSERNRSEAELLSMHQLFEIRYREGTLDTIHTYFANKN